MSFLSKTTTITFAYCCKQYVPGLIKDYVLLVRTSHDLGASPQSIRSIASMAMYA